MNYLPETAYLINAYGVNPYAWAEKIAGQKLDFETFDFDTLSDSAPLDATDGAQFLMEQIPGCISHNSDTDTWYVWNGIIHTPLKTNTVPLQLIDILGEAFKNLNEFLIEYRKISIKTIREGALSDDEKKKAIDAVRASIKMAQGEYSSFEYSLNSNKGVRDVLNKLERKVAKSREYFENDRAWLVVRNGVIDIQQFRETRQITLLQHDAHRPVYRYFDAEIDLNAGADVWNGFLSSSIVDADTVRLLQKAVGAAFSAEEKPRALFNLLGAPASGKSVFLSVFNRLGQGYTVMPNNQAIQQNANDTNFYQDELRGARFVGFSEVQGKKPLDDGFLKGILGGDQQNTRKMREMASPWKPQCVLFIASNMALKFDTRDEATFIKILPIPFPHSFTEVDPEHKMDRELENKVMEERNGILNWILQGMLMFWDEGLAPTEAVLESMNGNKTANSHALQFMEAMMDAGHVNQDTGAALSGCLSVGTAYEMFRTWAEANGIKNVPGKHTFSSDVADYYFGKDRSDGVRFVGLSMAPHFVQNLQNGLGHLILARNL